MYRNIKSLCYVQGTSTVLSITLQKQTNEQTLEKQIRFLVTRGGGWRGKWVEFDKDNQKVQTSSYNINKY